MNRSEQNKMKIIHTKKTIESKQTMPQIGPKTKQQSESKRTKPNAIDPKPKQSRSNRIEANINNPNHNDGIEPKPKQTTRIAANQTECNRSKTKTKQIKSDRS
jgi:hypothetical protein